MHGGDKIKVFLVDDDRMFTESLVHSLSDNKTEVEVFATGEACLEKMKQEEAGVVILDYCLNSDYVHAMNGIQILNKIKQASPDTKVIMLSSQDDVTVAVDT